jgi:hypothetical protein
MCSNYRYKAHNTSYESPWSPPHVETKKQAQTSRLRPPALAKLSAVGWSGSARFGSRYWFRMLFWANRGRSSLTRTPTDLVAPITRPKHHHSHFGWPIYYPYNTNQPICDLQHNRPPLNWFILNLFIKDATELSLFARRGGAWVTCKRF